MRGVSVPQIREEFDGLPVPQVTEEIFDGLRRVPVPQIREQFDGLPVPQVTEEIIDGVRGVPVPQIHEADSVVPQITEEILDGVHLVDVGSVVPLITEDGVDVVQVIPQVRVQNRTQQQIVGVLVRDKIATWEKIVEETQHVLSKRKQERETLREHTWCKDFGMFRYLHDRTTLVMH